MTLAAETAETRAKSLPFPQPGDTWMSRGVDAHDWETFLSFLLTPYWEDARRDVEGLVELEADVNLDMSGLNLSGSRSRDQTRPLLGESSAGGGIGSQSQSREQERLRRVRVEAVSSQWNEGFFGPRGLQIIINVNGPPTTGPTDPVAPRRNLSNVLQKRPPPEAEETLLHQLVGKWKKSPVKQLLEKGGEDVEALNKKIETPLFRAVVKGDRDIVQVLLEYGADPTARPPGSESPLHIACSNDKKYIVKALIETGKVNLREPNAKGETPLYAAVLRRQKDCIDVLLDAGSDPNARPLGQDSMLSIAVANDAKAAVNLIVRSGRVRIDELNSKGETPLYVAVQRRQKDSIETLLEAGANPNATPIGKDTMLHIAISHDSKGIAKMLLQHGVNVEDLKSGEPPLCRGEQFSNCRILFLQMLTISQPYTEPKQQWRSYFSNTVLQLPTEQQKAKPLSQWQSTAATKASYPSSLTKKKSTSRPKTRNTERHSGQPSTAAIPPSPRCFFGKAHMQARVQLVKKRC